MISPSLLALDFDGVLCDGLIEYFQSAWNAYCQIWQPDSVTPPDGLSESFYPLRPVIETGWEMPVLIRALVLRIPEAEILGNWTTVAKQIIQSEYLNPVELSQTLDHLRDRWIAEDLEGWLAQHRFYPGIVEQLQSLIHRGFPAIWIITTKEGRFVQQLLQQQQIELAPTQILGKESQRPKSQILRELLTTLSAGEEIWFVEDRLKTLQSVQKQADLGEVKLFLADWGYNTGIDRAQAQADDRIHLLSLSQFAQDFPDWVIPRVF